jgi:hypothetical protein
VEAEVMFTAQDIIDHLLTATGGGAQDGEHRAIRQAVVHGVREVFQSRQWLWHTKTGAFTTSQISTTATAITSGSPVITVANSTGIVPGRILAITPGYFANTVRVASVQGTSVTVDRPATATLVAPNTVTVLAQTYYDLPANVKDIDALCTETVGTLHCYVSPTEWQRLEVNTRGAGEPYYYTIMRSDVSPDRYQVRFVGVPTDGTVVSYTYRYIPEPIRLMGYEPSCRAGTATVAANSSTVTLTGNTLPQNLDDTVIRFGTATTNADPIGALSPFVSERRITSRLTDTTLTIDSALPAAVTGVKYAISDLLECSPQMYTAILSASEMWYARLAGKPAVEVVQLFNRDLRLAMENDVVSPLSGRPRMIDFPTARSMGWKSAQLPDEG